MLPQLLECLRLQQLRRSLPRRLPWSKLFALLAWTPVRAAASPDVKMLQPKLRYRNRPERMRQPVKQFELSGQHRDTQIRLGARADSA